MAGFGNNLSFNIFSVIKNFGKQGKELLNKLNPSPNQIENTNINTQGNKPATGQTLVNTNSNIVINQPVLTSPGVNQSALNSINLPKTNLNQDTKNNANTQLPSTPSQADYKGPSDLPAYAGISNMSLKSWIAEHNSKGFAKLESGEKQLISTLDGIKGFQKQNYEGSDDGSGEQALKQLAKKKYLLLLSHIFSSIEQSGMQDTGILVNIANFKKLGTSRNNNNETQDDSQDLNKLIPPLPAEINDLKILDSSNVKYLYQLLALPKEFPECLRLFAKDKLEINARDLNNFFAQRLKYVQEQVFNDSNLLNKTIAGFVPFLSPQDSSILLPLLLLYYPLPLPVVKEDFDFMKEWKKKDKTDSSRTVIASCDIYYISILRGSFLLKFELDDKNELSFDVQTAKQNNGIVKDLEDAIAESMFLLSEPPLLADLNVLLTQEIYKATDKDEELAISSTGPLRLEIILAVYGALIVLNKLSLEPDPSGLIEMNDIEMT